MPTTRRWFRNFVATAVVALSVAALAVANPGHAADRGESISSGEILPFDPNASCEAINEWIAVNRERLPSILGAVERYPMRYRRAIVASLPLETRIALWTAHIDVILGSETLDDDERQFLRATRERIPGWLRLPPDRDADRRIREEAVEALGMELAHRAIATLGRAETRSQSSPPLDCSCSRQSDWCSAGADCESLSCNVVSGCGTVWMYNCDGLCYRDQK
ncbi:MAG: bacteriocin fulvocin C-related protein [Gemmatimonadaceae bacterium]|jgi:hypothetical protein|nr:bacteriocin fulvocin C-related protein [Gemmatimonadaceae bacterium]